MKPEGQEPNEKITHPPLIQPDEGHPVATGVGLVGGAVAGAVAGSAIGPLGTVVGAILGGGFGSVAAKGLTEGVTPDDGRD